jgi:hypothetical protein
MDAVDDVCDLDARLRLSTETIADSPSLPLAMPFNQTVLSVSHGAGGRATSNAPSVEYVIDPAPAGTTTVEPAASSSVPES